jgi:photosystem II stability/assembly factor-like uncharacterized protein
MNTLLVGSRKGLFVLKRDAAADGGWRIDAHHFVAEPVSHVLADARDGSWVAALRLGHFGVKLHRSADQGATWQALAAPAFPPKPETGPLSEDATPWSVDMVWALAAGGASEPGTLWAGCLPAGLFKSSDGGQSWVLNTALWHEPRRLQWGGGGYDHAGIHSVLVDPRDARHVTIAVSTGGVWQTHDGGDSWALTARGMHATYMPPELAGDENSQDVHALVQCAAQPDVLWAQHHCGIFRSVDGGLQWSTVQLVPQTEPAPSGFGFAVACDPHNPQRAWFAPAVADACRLPVNGQLVVARTDDGGQSFEVQRDGLPQQHAYHLIYRHALQVTPDGQTLAMASTTGGLWASADAGAHWACISQHLPPIAVLAFAS